MAKSSASVVTRREFAKADKKIKEYEIHAVQEKFQECRSILRECFIERDEEIDLVLTALLCKENPLLVGMPGCLHGDTLIFDPISNTTRSVKERFEDGKEFHVVSKDLNGNLVVAKAMAPWKYPVSKMVRVTLQSGASFVVTPAHRIWNGVDFVKISDVSSELLRCGCIRLPSISAHSLSTQMKGASRLKKRASNSQDDYPLSFCFYGVQPPPDVSIDLSFSPSQSYVLEHIHGNCKRDDLEQEHKCNLYEQTYRLSKMGSMGRFAPPTESIDIHQSFSSFYELCLYLYAGPSQFCLSFLVDGMSQPKLPTFDLSRQEVSSSVFDDVAHLSCATLGPYEASSQQFPERLHTLQQSHFEVYQTLPVQLACPYQEVSSEAPVVFQDDHIIAIESVESSVYYDFHVPNYENYWCQGLFHHNTAKSMLLDSIMSWMGDDTKKFSILFNKFTVPEEVFGPISIQGLKNDCYRRITTSKLPEADVAFIDEIFKSSTAILNTMLRILNERVYENGDGSFQEVPLLLCVATSNEWPNTQEELGALFDRFLFRKTVKYISSRQGRDKLLWERNHTPDFDNHITREEIRDAQHAAKRLKFDDEGRIKFSQILDELSKEGIRPGDRRIYKAVDAVKAYAFLNGRAGDFVMVEDLEILSHILWNDPAEQPDKVAKIVCKIANPTGFVINDKMMQIQDILDKNEGIEAVPKLQDVLKELRNLPQKGNHEHKLRTAIKYVQSTLETEYNRVVGKGV